MTTKIIENTHHVTDPFWGDDWSILYKRDRLIEFVPKQKFSFAEKLNAMVRFTAYAGAGLFAYNRSVTYLYVPLLMLLITKLMWQYQNTALKESMSLSGPSRFYSDEQAPNPRAIVNGQECVAPSKDNPFMNVLMSDYRQDPNRPAACPWSDDKIKENANSNFYDNLFRDVNDVFGKTNSARQFYTMPATTIPNDQEDFAKFCYGDLLKPNCKEGNVVGCMNNDLRYNRKPPQLDVMGHKYI